MEVQRGEETLSSLCNRQSWDSNSRWLTVLSFGLVAMLHRLRKHLPASWELEKSRTLIPHSLLPLIVGMVDSH